MPVVVKQIPKSRITQLIESVPPEIYYHRRASDISGVCALLDWYERRTSWVLVLERDQRSVDLFELSSQYGALGEDAARVILRQVLQTSLQLAKNGVFHRDLKDENIMVNTRTLETKLIDFGCATTQHNADYTELIGTPEFFPPEYYTIKCYGAQASTTWTIGILMYVLLVGDIPFDNQHQIVSGKREKVSVVKVTSTDVYHLLLSTMKQACQERHENSCPECYQSIHRRDQHYTKS